MPLPIATHLEHLEHARPVDPRMSSPARVHSQSDVLADVSSEVRSRAELATNWTPDQYLVVPRARLQGPVPDERVASAMNTLCGRARASPSLPGCSFRTANAPWPRFEYADRRRPRFSSNDAERGLDEVTATAPMIRQPS